jgi:hypothetical protein
MFKEACKSLLYFGHIIASPENAFVKYKMGTGAGGSRL